MDKNETEHNPSIPHEASCPSSEGQQQAEQYDSPNSKDPLRIDRPTIQGEFQFHRRGDGDFGGDLAPADLPCVFPPPARGNDFDEAPEPPCIFPPPMGGDFAGDLIPGGYANHGRNPNTGNLMGPNHPSFASPGNVNIGPGGLGMRPRFDPIGPPGGPTDPGRNDPLTGRRVPPGGWGEPNPDHMRPPNDFGGGRGDMFM